MTRLGYLEAESDDLYEAACIWHLRIEAEPALETSDEMARQTDWRIWLRALPKNGRGSSTRSWPHRAAKTNSPCVTKRSMFPGWFDRMCSRAQHRWNYVLTQRI